MRSNFIAAWVTQQQQVFNQSTRGIMTPENRQVLENEAEAGMAAIERAVAEKAVRGFVRKVSDSVEDYLSIATLDALGAEYIRAAAYRREETE